jgi:uncharacterized MAPEG superfamily protein
VRLLVAVCAVAVATGAFAARADACSCVNQGPRAQLHDADGAFVGRLIEKRPRDYEAVYVFVVEQAVKGKFGTLAEVIAPAHGPSCGIEAAPRVRIGLLVRRDGPYLRSSLCWQVDADDLLAAARPLPKPNGRPPAVVLVGGQADGVQTMALDGRGRVLAYGPGRGYTMLLAACPGGRLALELGLGGIRVRALPRLRLVREIPLERSEYAPRSLCCGDPQASRIHVFGRRDGVGPWPAAARIVSVGAEARVTWTGEATAGSFDRTGTRAYLNTGKDGTSLMTLHLGDGRLEQTATLPPYTGPLVPSADGTQLAGVANPRRYVYPGAGPTSLVVVRPSGTVAVVPTSRRVSGEAAWWGSRVVFLPTYVPSEGVDRLVVYDPSRGTVRRLARWPAESGSVRGAAAYGVARGKVYAADLRTGRLRVISRVPTTLTRAFAVVPGGP